MERKSQLIGFPALLLICSLCLQGFHHEQNRKCVNRADTPLSGPAVCAVGLWVQVFNQSHQAEGTDTVHTGGTLLLLTIKCGTNLCVPAATVSISNMVTVSNLSVVCCCGKYRMNTWSTWSR